MTSRPADGSEIVTRRGQVGPGEPEFGEDVVAFAVGVTFEDDRLCVSVGEGQAGVAVVVARAACLPLGALLPDAFEFGEHELAEDVGHWFTAA